jgi:imidazoleglycerol-phosphate dehydratase
MIRKASIERKTSETEIRVSLNLDEYTRGKMDTGSGFLDHMLDLFQVHSGIGLEVYCKGDTYIDMHHSCEDIAIAMGQCMQEALGDKKGIERYGFYTVPMDEALCRAVLDFSGRFAIEYHVPLQQNQIGNLDTEMIEHFFYSFAENARMNLHLDLLRGKNTHHCIEGIFKAFARATAMAISPSARLKGVPSSKGTLNK